MEPNLQQLKQKLFQQQLEETDIIYNAIFNQAPIGIAIYNTDIDSDGINFIKTNLIFQQITGRSDDEIKILGWKGITHPDDLDEDIKNYNLLKEGKMENYSMDKRYIKPDGSFVWVHMIIAPFKSSDDNIFQHICLIQDISKEKEIEYALSESERSKSVLLSNLPGMAYRSLNDTNWTMEFISAGCFTLTGYTSESLLHNNIISFNDIILPQYREILREEWNYVLLNKMYFKYEYQIRTAFGEIKWVQELGQGIYDNDGNVEALEGIIFDITDRKDMENTLIFNSNHDLLTGLSNRKCLEDILNSDAKKDLDVKRALISINVSSIHFLSLKYGSNYTFNLVKNIAERLKALCTENYQLFRMYEYQFTFYIKDYKNNDELRLYCEGIKKLLESMLTTERISGCIGVLEVSKSNTIEVQELFKNLLITSERTDLTTEADFSIQYFDEDFEFRIRREESIVSELTEIIANKRDERLFLQYQPVLDLRTNKISGFECLARLRSDNFGLVPPMEFITIAEKSKLIIPLGNSIIIKALKFVQTLKARGYKDVSVSINISVIQLLKKGFSEFITNMIEIMDVNPQRIVLEITESEFEINNSDINEVLYHLKNFGVKIAIDDFGTGYSSLARLRELNIDYLKIDRSFINSITSHKAEEAITGDIIKMSHRMAHIVVAEGVEYKEQLDYLIDNGCDKVQGYLISKPLDEDNALKFLNEYEDNNLGHK